MVSRRLSGKLAVILHADVVGSTELVQRDEHKAHERIQDTFRRFGEIISTYQGQVRELRGDALLAEFDRASDAVSSALAFQAKQGGFNEQFDDDVLPLVRVGIALGEVVIADDTITGAGVVLAQRLEQLAEPGGVVITPAIREALPRRLPFVLENLGEHDLKGFDEPIGAYRVKSAEGVPVPAPYSGGLRELGRPSRRSKVTVTALVAALIAVAVFGFVVLQPMFASNPFETRAGGEAGRPSIAILPFDNMGADPEQEYFADGITEDLTTDLSKISGLFVVARNTAFSYKGRDVDVRKVAEELGVRYVLEGSIRRASNRIRINAQLIDGVSGGHIWAERFDGALADVFALQDHVNRKIVSALEISLTAAEKQQFDRVETTVPEAYDLLLQGVEKYNEFNREAIAEGRELFLRAIELDPEYARAYANVALTHATYVNFYWSEDRERSIRKGLEYASKAMEIDDSIPQIYMTRSTLYLSQRKYQAALEAAQRTVEVHPNYADGYATLAFISSYSGEFTQALEALQKAKQINPQSTGIYLGVEGRVLFLMRRYDEALPLLEESVERNPGFDTSQLNLAAVYAELGRLDDASWAIDEALSINPEITLTKLQQDNLYRRQEDAEHYYGALRKAGMPE